MIRAAILGASGYTGADLIRLALGHPDVRLVALGANTQAGASVAEVWPQFAMFDLPRMAATADIDLGAVDVVFGCLPHGASAALLAGIAGPRIVDLSADFRLDDAAVYAAWYGGAHPAPERLADAVYGLTEYARDRLPGARLVACPGCYPTAALLALLPLAGLIDPARIAITALSGVTGAGRSLKQANLFAEAAESAGPYAIGHHRHMPEIEQELARGFGLAEPVPAGFTPHLVPMNRGESVTCTVELASGATLDGLRDALVTRYAAEPFVHVLPSGVAPSTRHVRGSNHVVVNVFADRIPGRAVVAAAIDNLVKGSAGQALQNMNLMFGLPERAGLTQAPLFP